MRWLASLALITCVVVLLRTIDISPLSKRLPFQITDGQQGLAPRCQVIHQRLPSNFTAGIINGNHTSDLGVGDWGSLRCKEKDFELYMYSAFYDDRELLENTGPAVVRVTGTSEYQDRVGVTLMCILKYPDDPDPEVTLARDTKINKHRNHHGKTFQEFIYVCPIRRQGVVPELVSIVCSSVAKPPFYLKVETAEQPTEKRDFAICVCASYSSRDVYQLVEWMELQQILGVSKVIVYNHSICDETARIFLHYVDEELVHFRQTHAFWEETGSPHERVKQHKAPTINDCLYINMYSFKKILVIDFDELIVPRLHANLSEMLAAIDRDYPSSHMARTYVFRNDYFPFELPPDESISPKLVTMRFRKRLPPSKMGFWAKSIVDPMACTNMHHHYCWGWTNQYNTAGHTIEVNTSIGMNQHYKNYCHGDSEECAGRIQEHYQDDTMLRFKDKLIPRVQKQLEKLRIEPL